MAAKTTFQPHTIEITKRLDLSDADDKALSKFRENPFSDEDAILQMAVGPGASPKRIILWAKWLQFVQRIAAAEGAGPSAPLTTEEVTRRYRVEAE